MAAGGPSWHLIQSSFDTAGSPAAKHTDAHISKMPSTAHNETARLEIPFLFIKPSLIMYMDL
jgi:hypothetical protein